MHILFFSDFGFVSAEEFDQNRFWGDAGVPVPHRAEACQTGPLGDCACRLLN